MATLPLPTLFICHQCGLKDEAGKKIPNPKNADLAAAVRRELAARNLTETDVQVVLSGCLSVCDPHPTWALTAPGRYTYVFSPAGNPTSMADFVQTYLAKPPGLPVYKKDWPASFAEKQVSKVPPIPE